MQPRYVRVFDCASLNTYPAGGFNVLASPRELASAITRLVPDISGLGWADRFGAWHRGRVLELASIAAVKLRLHTSEETYINGFRHIGYYLPRSGSEHRCLLHQQQQQWWRWASRDRPDLLSWTVLGTS